MLYRDLQTYIQAAYEAFRHSDVYMFSLQKPNENGIMRFYANKMEHCNKQQRKSVDEREK